MGFDGSAYSSMDAKGRLVFPAKFRNQLGENPKIVKGYDHCLYIYTEEEYQKALDRLVLLDEDTQEGRLLQRMIVGSKEDCVLDGQGRMMISSELRKYAFLKKDVLFSGVINRVEIWDTEKYEEYERENDSKIDEAVAKSKAAARAQAGNA